MTSEGLRVHGGAEVSASGGSSALLDRGVRTDVAPKAVAQGMLLARLVLTVERLERTNRELDEFARLTAHDLSAPLLALSRLVELLPANDGTDQAATLAAIRSSVDRMSAMVDGV